MRSPGRSAARRFLLCLAMVAGAWTVAEGQVQTFTLGGALHPWERGGDGTDPEFLSGTTFNPVVDTTNTPGDRIEFAAQRGWVSASFFDGQRNIASLVLEGGKIEAPNALTMATSLRRAQLEGTVNGDHDVAFERKPAPFQPVVPAFGIWIILDFGQRIGVERIRFYPRNTLVPNPDKPFHNDFLRGYEVWVNDRLTNPVLFTASWRNSCTWVPPECRFGGKTLSGDLPSHYTKEDTQWVKLKQPELPSKSRASARPSIERCVSKRARIV